MDCVFSRETIDLSDDTCRNHIGDNDQEDGEIVDDSETDDIIAVHEIMDRKSYEVHHRNQRSSRSHYEKCRRRRNTVSLRSRSRSQSPWHNNSGKENKRYTLSRRRLYSHHLERSANLSPKPSQRFRKQALTQLDKRQRGSNKFPNPWNLFAPKNATDQHACYSDKIIENKIPTKLLNSSKTVAVTTSSNNAVSNLMIPLVSDRIEPEIAPQCSSATKLALTCQGNPPPGSLGEMLLKKNKQKDNPVECPKTVELKVPFVITNTQLEKENDDKENEMQLRLDALQSAVVSLNSLKNEKFQGADKLNTLNQTVIKQRCSMDMDLCHSSADEDDSKFNLKNDDISSPIDNVVAGAFAPIHMPAEWSYAMAPPSVSNMVGSDMATFSSWNYGQNFNLPMLPSNFASSETSPDISRTGDANFIMSDISHVADGFKSTFGDVDYREFLWLEPDAFTFSGSHASIANEPFPTYNLTDTLAEQYKVFMTEPLQKSVPSEQLFADVEDVNVSKNWKENNKSNSTKELDYICPIESSVSDLQLGELVSPQRYAQFMKVKRQKRFKKFRNKSVTNDACIQSVYINEIPPTAGMEEEDESVLRATLLNDLSKKKQAKLKLPVTSNGANENIKISHETEKLNTEKSTLVGADVPETISNQVSKCSSRVSSLKKTEVSNKYNSTSTRLHRHSHEHTKNPPDIDCFTVDSKSARFDVIAPGNITPFRYPPVERIVISLKSDSESDDDAKNNAGPSGPNSHIDVRKSFDSNLEKLLKTMRNAVAPTETSHGNKLSFKSVPSSTALSATTNAVKHLSRSQQEEYHRLKEEIRQKEKRLDTNQQMVNKVGIANNGFVGKMKRKYGVSTNCDNVATTFVQRGLQTEMKKKFPKSHNLPNCHNERVICLIESKQQVTPKCESPPEVVTGNARMQENISTAIAQDKRFSISTLPARQSDKSLDDESMIVEEIESSSVERNETTCLKNDGSDIKNIISVAASEILEIQNNYSESVKRTSNSVKSVGTISGRHSQSQVPVNIDSGCNQSKLLASFENVYLNKRSCIGHVTSKLTKVVEDTVKLKRGLLLDERKVAEMRNQLALAEKELQVKKMTVDRKINLILKMQKELFQSNQQVVEFENLGMCFGRKLQGHEYNLPGNLVLSSDQKNNLTDKCQLSESIEFLLGDQRQKVDICVNDSNIKDFGNVNKVPKSVCPNIPIPSKMKNSSNKKIKFMSGIELNEMKELCPYDLLGRCNDDVCPYQHLSSQNDVSETVDNNIRNVSSCVMDLKTSPVCSMPVLEQEVRLNFVLHPNGMVNCQDDKLEKFVEPPINLLTYSESKIAPTNVSEDITTDSDESESESSDSSDSSSESSTSDSDSESDDLDSNIIEQKNLVPVASPEVQQDTEGDNVSVKTLIKSDTFPPSEEKEDFTNSELIGSPSNVSEIECRFPVMEMDEISSESAPVGQPITDIEIYNDIVEFTEESSIKSPVEIIEKENTISDCEAIVWETVPDVENFNELVEIIENSPEIAIIEPFVENIEKVHAELHFNENFTELNLVSEQNVESSAADIVEHQAESISSFNSIVEAVESSVQELNESESENYVDILKNVVCTEGKFEPSLKESSKFLEQSFEYSEFGKIACFEESSNSSFVSTTGIIEELVTYPSSHISQDVSTSIEREKLVCPNYQYKFVPCIGTHVERKLIKQSSANVSSFSNDPVNRNKASSMQNQFLYSTTLLGPKWRQRLGPVTHANIEIDQVNSAEHRYLSGYDYETYPEIAVHNANLETCSTKKTIFTRLGDRPTSIQPSVVEVTGPWSHEWSLQTAEYPRQRQQRHKRRSRHTDNSQFNASTVSKLESPYERKI